MKKRHLGTAAVCAGLFISAVPAIAAQPVDQLRAAKNNAAQAVANTQADLAAKQAAVAKAEADERAARALQPVADFFAAREEFEALLRTIQNELDHPTGASVTLKPKYERYRSRFAGLLRYGFGLELQEPFWPQLTREQAGLNTPEIVQDLDTDRGSGSPAVPGSNKGLVRVLGSVFKALVADPGIVGTEAKKIGGLHKAFTDALNALNADPSKDVYLAAHQALGDARAQFVAAKAAHDGAVQADRVAQGQLDAALTAAAQSARKRGVRIAVRPVFSVSKRVVRVKRLTVSHVPASSKVRVIWTDTRGKRHVKTVVARRASIDLVRSIPALRRARTGSVIRITVISRAGKRTGLSVRVKAPVKHKKRGGRR